MTRLTFAERRKLSRLLEMDDALTDVCVLLRDRRGPEEYSAESLGRILAVLEELRDEAGAAFVSARRGAGIPDPV